MPKLIWIPACHGWRGCIGICLAFTVSGTDIHHCLCSTIIWIPACHGWRGCNGICLAFTVSGTEPRHTPLPLLNPWLSRFLYFLRRFRLFLGQCAGSNVRCSRFYRWRYRSHATAKTIPLSIQDHAAAFPTCTPVTLLTLLHGLPFSFWPKLKFSVPSLKWYPFYI